MLRETSDVRNTSTMILEVSGGTHDGSTGSMYDIALGPQTIMGATNPEEADAGTIRKEFAESIEANSVHGSDSLDNANSEIAFFFAGIELFI